MVTDGCLPEVPPTYGDIECDFSAFPSQLIYPRRQASLSWACVNAGSCSISGLGGVDPESGTVEVDVPASRSFTLACANEGGSRFSEAVEVVVLKPTYCEIIPQGPGC